MNWRTCALLIISAACGRAAETDPVALLARVRVKVVADAKKILRFMCRQVIERRTFTMPSKSECSAVIIQKDRATSEGRLHLAAFDRAKLDVMLAQGTEMSAWPGQDKFDTKDPGDLLRGGLSGSGDFASFVIHIFTLDDVTFNYEGACAPNSCERFSYNVPLGTAAYVLKTRLEQVVVAYHGTFDVDPRTAELMRLSVIPIEPERAFPKVCELQTEIVYASSDTKSGKFMIPKSTVKSLLLSDGHYLENRSSYEGCHEYTTESLLTFGEKARSQSQSDAQPPAWRLPPPGTQFELRLTSRIDSDTAAEGDQLEGALTKDLRDASGGLVAAAGTIFHGHLDRVEHDYGARPLTVIGIRFDRIVLDEKEIPLALAATRDMDLRGAAIFTFHSSRVTLGKLVSHWVVREPVR